MSLARLVGVALALLIAAEFTKNETLVAQPFAIAQLPRDAWEGDPKDRPQNSACTSNIDEVYYAAVTEAALPDSISQLETTPVKAVDQDEAIKLLGLDDSDKGTALVQIITRAIDGLQREKRLGDAWTLAAQRRLDWLADVRESPQTRDLTPFLIRAVGHDVVYTRFIPHICGDTLWVTSVSPNFPDAAVRRLAIVAFLGTPPQKLFLDRAVR